MPQSMGKTPIFQLSTWILIRMPCPPATWSLRPHANHSSWNYYAPLTLALFLFVLRCVISTALCSGNEKILRHNKCKAITLWFLSLFFPQVSINFYFHMLNFFIHKFLCDLCKSLLSWYPGQVTAFPNPFSYL